MLLKRTNLNNVQEVADFRAAISFLQGEPGVDPERIGIWGSSNGGTVVVAVAAADARVKAVVSQVSGAAPSARGTGADRRADARGRDQARAHRPGRGSRRRLLVQKQGRRVERAAQSRRAAGLDARPDSRRRPVVLFLPAENDELSGRGGAGALAATKYLTDRGVTAQTIVFPELTHFQAYSNTGFDVGSTLAADWFLKYLGRGAPPKAATAPEQVRR